MKDLDVSEGLKEDLHSELVASLDGSDRDIAKGFSPNDITLYQRTNGRGMFYHDARYLWLRLLRRTGKRDFGVSLHEFSRCTVVREDAVLEAVNRLDKDKRLRLLALAERDFQKQHRPNRSRDSTQQILEDIDWHRFQTFKDLLIRGQLELDDVSLQHQTRGGFFSASDLEAFGAILDCHVGKPDSDEPTEFDDEEGEFSLLQSFNEQQAADEVEEVPENRHEPTLEEREKDRLKGVALDSWRHTASEAETALLTEHQSDRMRVELVPYLKRRFLPRFGVGVTLESILQKDVEGERLFTYDDHTAQTKFSKSGLAFGEKVIRNVDHADRAKLIDSMAEHFREECKWECERLCHQVPVLRSYAWARTIARPFLQRLQTVLLKAGEEAVTLLRHNDGKEIANKHL